MTEQAESRAAVVDFSLIVPAIKLAWKGAGVWIPSLLLIGAANLCLSSPIYYVFKIAGWSPKDAGVPDWVFIAILQVILFPVSLTFGAITAGLYNLALKQIEGERPRVLDILNFRGQFIQLIIVFFLINVAVAVGTVLFVFPGFIVNALLSLAPLLVLERGMSAISALRVSWQTVKPHLWPMLAYTVIVNSLGTFGLLACCIGVFWTTPIYMIAMSLQYRRFFPSLPSEPLR